MITLLLVLALQQQCVDFSKDPAGCQPSTFDTPIGQMPSVRVNRQGSIDPFSSEEDARAGAAALEKELHLFRNFEHLHWVLTVPSVKDSATGAWKGGDLDGAGDGRGLGIAGNCIFVGHGNGAGVRHAVNIFKIQANPEKQAPSRSARFPPCLKAIKGSTNANCGRSSTKPRVEKTGISWCVTRARIRSAGWKRFASIRIPAFRFRKARLTNSTRNPTNSSC